MKTLEQIAEAAGVTRAAIYKRFQNYGLSVNQLKAEKQGKIKVYGEDIERLIILMFQPDTGVESLVERNGKTKGGETQDLQGLEGCFSVESLVERNGEKSTKIIPDGGTVERSVESLVEMKEAKIQELQGLAASLEVERKAAESGKETAETRAAAAEEKAAAAEARAERAEAQAEALLHQVDKLTDAIRAAEAIQAAQLAKLPAPPPEGNKGGFFRRLRNRIKGGKEA